MAAVKSEAKKWQDWKRKAKQQGITKERLRIFKRDGKEREELYGDLPGFFYIKLASGGAWRLRYSDPTGTGKRITATIAGDGATPVEARAIAEEWRVKIRKGIDPQNEHRKNAEETRRAKQESERRRFARLGTFLDEIYTPHTMEMSTNGKAALGHLRRFEHLFDRDMDTLTFQDVEAWEAKRKTEGVTRQAMQRELAALKGMLSYAAGTKKGDRIGQPVIDRNPLAGMGLSKPTAAEREADRLKEEEGSERFHTLSPEEFERIDLALETFAEEVRQRRERSRKHGRAYLPSLDGLRYPHWFEVFYQIAKLTGARPGDVLRLRWTNIQTDLRSRCEVLRYTPRKTEHHEDPIEIVFPITGRLVEVLSTWKQQQGNPSRGLLFPSERTGKAMNRTAYHRHWHKVKELADLPANLDLYNLRHTFISDRVNAGWPLLRLAKLVGHKNTRMIAETYYRDDTDDLSTVLLAMENGERRGAA